MSLPCSLFAVSHAICGICLDEKLFVVYLKFELNWCPVLLFANLAILSNLFSIISIKLTSGLKKIYIGTLVKIAA